MKRPNVVTIPLPTPPAGGFRCIVADPSWRFNDRGSRLAPDQVRKRRGRKGYRTLELEAIASMPVREVAADNALLFLWTTDSHLVDGSAAEVAIRWGFEPKRIWTWVKVGPPPDLLAGMLARASFFLGEMGERAARKVGEDLKRFIAGSSPELVQGGRLAFGGGHYVRTADEKVLICRRGLAGFRVHDERSVFFAPRRRHEGTGETHSVKPVELLERVERVCGGPRLELFARSGRPGWESWGDQAPEEAAA
jgi:N6-adenosine-specific RNA methylase IME4